MTTSHHKMDYERYRLMVENTNDLVATIDLQGNFTYVSPSHEKILGYTVEELLGKNSFSLIHPADRKLAYATFQKGLLGKEMDISIFRARHKDGSWKYLETTAASVATRNNRPYMFITILRDVTSRVNFEQKKDEFINILCHELRTPMTTILALTSILEKELGNEQNGLRIYSSKLEEQTENLAKLIENLVDISEIQLGALRLKKEKFFLAKLIENLIAFYHTKIKHKMILQADKTIKINADKKRLGEVINAVLSNAIKYSEPQKPIKINLYKKDGKAEVAIADSGPGIPKEEQEKIFEKFYQVGDQKKFSRPGFGVGLFFAREIIQMHKGNLWTKSKQGEGSTFYFSLPLAS